MINGLDTITLQRFLYTLRLALSLTLLLKPPLNLLKSLRSGVPLTRLTYRLTTGMTIQLRSPCSLTTSSVLFRLGNEIS